MNSKTGWGLNLTLPAPDLTDEQKAKVRKFAQDGHLRIRQDMSTGDGEESYTYAAVVVSGDDDPDRWLNLSSVFGLTQPLEIGVAFDIEGEGDADEASATAHVLHSTWGEEKVLEFLGLADEWEPDLYTTVDFGMYPNLMNIKQKGLD